jgi:3-oxoacyl-[acyl-carrier protein] reductase
MECDLEGRTALISGSGRGMGKKSAEKLAENGANIVINDVDADVAEATATEIRDLGAEAIGVPADVSDEAEVEAMVQEATEEFGTIDILVNNAGIGDVDRFTNKPDDTLWDLNLGTHLRGAIYCSKHAIDGMVEQEYGKILNMTSIHTKNGIGMSPQYDVAKYGLLGLTKTLALELGREGIRVNAIAPGFAETRLTENFTEETREQILDLNPLGRFAQPDEVANAVLYLVSPAGDYINGEELRIDGGQQPIDTWKHEDYRFE